MEEVVHDGVVCNACRLRRHSIGIRELSSEEVVDYLWEDTGAFACILKHLQAGFARALVGGGVAREGHLEGWCQLFARADLQRDVPVSMRILA